MSEKITFKELVEKISKSTNQSEQKTNSFIHELTGIIESGLGKGEKITISGFGKFELRWMDSRKGLNPQTGEEITIPAQNKIYFKSYKDLREHVNEPYLKLEPKIIAGDSVSESGISEAEEKKQSELNIDDLIRERPSPVKSKVPEFVGEEDLPNMFSDPVPASENTGKADISEKEEIQREKKDDKKFYWPYTATAIVILLVILLFFVWMLRTDDVTDEIAQDTVIPAPTEQITPPDESIPSATSDESEADPPAMEVHSISSGETLWSIADRSYGDPYLWPIIFEHNSDEIENPDYISTGSSLNLPNLHDSTNLTQKDRQTVARGYLYVYDWMTDQQPDNARYYLWAVGAYSQEELQRVSARVNESDLVFATQR